MVPSRFFVGSLLMLLATAVPALAQVIPMPASDASDVPPLTGGVLFSDPREILDFIVDMLLSLALSASIAWHPVRLRDRKTIEDVSKPLLFLLYGLIGMAVGFLVVRHGYIIGFVVFGMGALLRFRNSMDKTEDTVQVMLVTILGLSVGLGLPVSAVLLALMCWVLIWLSGRSRAYELVLKSTDTQALEAGVISVQAVLEKRRGACLNRINTPSKSSVHLLIKVPAAVEPATFESEVRTTLPPEVAARFQL